MTAAPALATVAERDRSKQETGSEQDERASLGHRVRTSQVPSGPLPP